VTVSAALVGTTAQLRVVTVGSVDQSFAGVIASFTFTSTAVVPVGELVTVIVTASVSGGQNPGIFVSVADSAGGANNVYTRHQTGISTSQTVPSHSAIFSCRLRVALAVGTTFTVTTNNVSALGSAFATALWLQGVSRFDSSGNTAVTGSPIYGNLTMSRNQGIVVGVLSNYANSGSQPNTIGIFEPLPSNSASAQWTQTRVSPFTNGAQAWVVTSAYNYHGTTANAVGSTTRIVAFNIGLGTEWCYVNAAFV
jgi:hypothetical protein